MNARYRVLIEPIKNRLKGKRILDLASHDGRWSYACLVNGAAHVTGIEGRASLIEKSGYFIKGPMRERVRFIAGDIFEVMPRLLAEGEHFDVVLCLGIFYHVMDHHRLVTMMAAFRPELIVVDSGLVDSDEPKIVLKVEDSRHFLNAIPVDGANNASLVGFVSRGGIELMAKCHGYGVTYLPWDLKTTGNHPILADYFNRSITTGARRFSLLMEPAPFSDDDLLSDGRRRSRPWWRSRWRRLRRAVLQATSRSGEGAGR